MKKNKGFTLIELLAVIAILGVLLSISVVAVNKIMKKQNVENKLNVISSIMTGAKNYIADHPEFWDSNNTGNYETGSPNPTGFGQGRWLKISDIIEYADFDKDKYPELYYEDNINKTGERKAFIRNCSNELKYEVIYSYKEAGATDYSYILTDCGCQEQASSDNSFKFCDAELPGAGWNLNGEYYLDINNRRDSSKDIKFEK